MKYLHSLFTKYLLALPIFTMVISSVAIADTEWMKSADSCELFKPAFNAYLDKIDLENYKDLPFWQREELSVVFKRACSGKFSVCKIEACNRWGSIGRSALGDQLSDTSEVAWLSRFLTCEQLLEQIESRYSSLSPKQISLPSTKRELSLVLEASCSERFLHCKFRSCENLESNNNGLKKTKISQLSAPQYLEKLVRQYEALRAVKIQAEKERETKGKLEWLRMTNPSEARVVAQRREQEKERKDTEQIEETSESPFSFNRPQRPANRKPSRRRNPSSGGGVLPF